MLSQSKGAAGEIGREAVDIVLRNGVEGRSECQTLLVFFVDTLGSRVDSGEMGLVAGHRSAGFEKIKADARTDGIPQLRIIGEKDTLDISKSDI